MRLGLGWWLTRGGLPLRSIVSQVALAASEKGQLAADWAQQRK